MWRVAASTSSTSAASTGGAPVCAGSGSRAAISQSRLGPSSAATDNRVPFCAVRPSASPRHSSIARSRASAGVGANSRPVSDTSGPRPRAIPMSWTDTSRPSSRLRTAAMTSGAVPRGCWPRSQRVTEVLS